MLEALNDYAVIEPCKNKPKHEEKTVSGIYIPNSKPQWDRVGVVISGSSYVGATVYYVGGYEVSEGGKTYHLVKCNDIMAKVVEDNE